MIIKLSSASIRWRLLLMSENAAPLSNGAKPALVEQ